MTVVCSLLTVEGRGVTYGENFCVILFLAMSCLIPNHTTSFSCYQNFNTYFQKLKERLYEYVLKLRNQLQHVHLWTRIICESIKHVFKISINWKQQSIPEFVKTLHEQVKLTTDDDEVIPKYERRICMRSFKNRH